ncbi:ABC transporter substrate-binding protein [Citricoccus sp. K5]|uniref:ABC transporter substrate-binding protein n=1 Tax=Citricoccus sp. K5 TaxID=2653135 RepID=UPI0012EEE863|nr:ABC transporter substrate-binding protein [Citricoccus sp. K5]VXC09039.1 Leu/Ile/Val-binding protein homolog 5 [Citricoccus sp. K5]
MRRKCLAAAAVAMMMGLTACSGGGASAGAGDTIAIGAVHPLSGGLAGVGGMMNDGAALAVEDINESGGIQALDGAQLELRDGDSQGSAQTGQSEAQRLISEGAVALVGTYQSDVTENVASAAERADVPMVIDVAVDDKIMEQGYENIFRIQPNASSMGQAGAETLAAMGETAGVDVEKVAYLHIEGAFGTSVSEAFTEEAEAQGIEVVSTVSYPATNFSDATTQVKQALSADPDVVVVTGYYPDNVLVAEAVQALNPDILGVFGIASGAFDDSSFPTDAGAAATNVLSANYHYAATSERSQDIRERFEEKYGRPMETAAMLSYQAVEVIAAGLEESGSADPEALRDAIANTSIEDPLLAFDGPIEFDETGENKNATVIVMQSQDGEIEQVFPEEFATAELIFPARDQ